MSSPPPVTPPATSPSWCRPPPGAEVLIGDAAYTPWEYGDPGDERLPSGQAADLTSWRESLHRIHSAEPSQVHFCHSTDTVAR